MTEFDPKEFISQWERFVADMVRVYRFFHITDEASDEDIEEFIMHILVEQGYVEWQDGYYILPKIESLEEIRKMLTSGWN